MDIAQISMLMSQNQVQQSAGAQVQKMAMDGMKDESAALLKLLQSSVPIVDPALGNQVNILA